MSSSSLKIACIGECMVEFAPSKTQTYKKSFAGDTFNTAVYLKRQFETQLDVSYVSALGCDSLSNDILLKMQLEGIETCMVRRLDGGKPGLYLIENDDNGEREFTYWRDASAARSMFKNFSTNDIYQKLYSYDLIYLSGITLAILDHGQRSILLNALEKLQNKCTIAFDPNYRPALWDDKVQCIEVFKRMAGLSNTLLSTYDDDLSLFGFSDLDTAAQRWLSWGSRVVVMKNGAWGCSVYTADSQVDIAPPAKIKAVDTTGAGDSFCAGFLGAKLLGASVIDAATFGHKVAGQVIQFSGGVIALEHWQSIVSKSEVNPDKVNR